MEVLLDQNVTTSFSMPVVPSSGITAKRRRATYDFRAPIVKKKKPSQRRPRQLLLRLEKQLKRL